MGASRTKTNCASEKKQTNTNKGAVYRRNTRHKHPTQTPERTLPKVTTKIKPRRLTLENDAKVFTEPKQPKNEHPDKRNGPLRIQLHQNQPPCTTNRAKPRHR